MPQQELLKKVIEVLSNLQIDYMLTGSIVSSLQGEPRSTHDIDIVVAVKRSAAKDMTAAFPAPDYYLSEESILEALDSRGMFNLIEVNTGDKIDFWVLTNQPFDASRFRRKYVEDVMGMKLAVSAPEDTILAKLHWAKESGGGEKHVGDALRVYEVQYGKLDLEYLRSWARELGVSSILEKMEGEAEKI
jgi:hypothetical protein